MRPMAARQTLENNLSLLKNMSKTVSGWIPSLV